MANAAHHIICETLKKCEKRMLSKDGHVPASLGSLWKVAANIHQLQETKRNSAAPLKVEITLETFRSQIQ